jgi:hypothetical protein
MRRLDYTAYKRAAHQAAVQGRRASLKNDRRGHHPRAASAFPQIWCPNERRRTCLVEHVGATIMDIRKARLDSFKEFKYTCRREIHKFLKGLARVGPNADKTYICQPPIQDFRITYRPSDPSARTIVVDIYEVECITFGAVEKAARELVEGIEPHRLRAIDPQSLAARGRRLVSVGNYQAKTSSGRERSATRITSLDAVVVRRKNGQTKWDKRRSLHSKGNSQAKT